MQWASGAGILGQGVVVSEFGYLTDDPISCLLYTSDAADERSSVDLGGRRIIKKKKHSEAGEWTEAS